MKRYRNKTDQKESEQFSDVQKHVLVVGDDSKLSFYIRQCFCQNTRTTFPLLDHKDTTHINNNAKSNRLQDQVFWYKADGHNDFKLGSKEFWELSKGMGSDDEEEQYDPQNVKKRGAGPKISVRKSKW